MVLGVVLLFVGAAGAFNLFEKPQPNSFLGEEVPRDMIEAGFAVTPAAQDSAPDQGDAPS